MQHNAAKPNLCSESLDNLKQILFDSFKNQNKLLVLVKKKKKKALETKNIFEHAYII